jgi:N-methylhydantoinase A
MEELGCVAEVPVHQRSTLCASDTIDGPALVEQEDSTVLIPAERIGTVDPAGNIIITAPARQAEKAAMGEG